MASRNNEPITLPARPRRFIEEVSLPFLVETRLYDPGRKPRGMARLKRKAGQVADDLVHGWLNVPSRGSMRINLGGDRTGVVEFDAHQSAYLAFASRDRHGGYEPAESMFLETVLGRSGVFYDVGCNWGYFSLLAASHPVFQGRIFAFDVSSEMNSALAGMVQSLGLSNLCVAGYGLSDTTGTVGLSAGRSAHLTRVTGRKQEAGAAERMAQVWRLDDLTLPPPDLIKIDVEDHEAAVFDGGRATLTEHRPLILFECRGDRVGGAAGEILGSLGYQLYTLGFSNGAKPVLELSPVGVGDLSLLGHTNLVAVAEGDQARWFG